MINSFAHRPEPSGNFPVGYPHNVQPLFFQICCAFTVILLFSGFTMLGTIQFDYKFCFVTIEVCDVLSEGILTMDRDWVCFQKIVP